MVRIKTNAFSPTTGNVQLVTQNYNLYERKSGFVLREFKVQCNRSIQNKVVQWDASCPCPLPKSIIDCTTNHQIVHLFISNLSFSFDISSSLTLQAAYEAASIWNSGLQFPESPNTKLIISFLNWIKIEGQDTYIRSCKSRQWCPQGLWLQLDHQ